MPQEEKDYYVSAYTTTLETSVKICTGCTAVV